MISIEAMGKELRHNLHSFI